MVKGCVSEKMKGMKKLDSVERKIEIKNVIVRRAN
jgi:hypothetical protein